MYKACRDNKVISIFYDFSFGYPITKRFIGKPQSDTFRSPNYLITFGIQRCNQYNALNKYKHIKSNTFSIKTISPLIEFARDTVKRNINFKNELERKYYLSKVLKISIFDNVYGYNLYIIKKDASSCINALESSPLEKIILSHNKKRSFLSKYLTFSKLIYFCKIKPTLVMYFLIL